MALVRGDGGPSMGDMIRAAQEVAAPCREHSVCVELQQAYAELARLRAENKQLRASTHNPPFESTCANQHALIAHHGDSCPLCAALPAPLDQPKARRRRKG